MRGKDKYELKVLEEMDVYRRHLFTGEPLSERYSASYQAVAAAKARLGEGLSDEQVITSLQNDPNIALGERRSREILALAYMTFAEIRIQRNADGVKLRYASIFLEKAKKIDADIQAARENDDPKAAAELYGLWMKAMKEAAAIDGAYDKAVISGEEKKRPQKIILKRTTKTVHNRGLIVETNTDEAEYEVDGD